MAYSLWLFVINGLIMATVLAALCAPRVFATLRPNWRGGLSGGAMLLTAYTIAILAMAYAPVAMV